MIITEGKILPVREVLTGYEDSPEQNMLNLLYIVRRDIYPMLRTIKSWKEKSDTKEIKDTIEEEEWLSKLSNTIEVIGAALHGSFRILSGGWVAETRELNVDMRTKILFDPYLKNAVHTDVLGNIRMIWTMTDAILTKIKREKAIGTTLSYLLETDILEKKIDELISNIENENYAKIDYFSGDQLLPIIESQLRRIDIFEKRAQGVFEEVTGKNVECKFIVSVDEESFDIGDESVVARLDIIDWFIDNSLNNSIRAVIQKYIDQVSTANKVEIKVNIRLVRKMIEGREVVEICIGDNGRYLFGNEPYFFENGKTGYREKGEQGEGPGTGVGGFVLDQMLRTEKFGGSCFLRPHIIDGQVVGTEAVLRLRTIRSEDIQMTDSPRQEH